MYISLINNHPPDQRIPEKSYKPNTQLSKADAMRVNYYKPTDEKTSFPKNPKPQINIYTQKIDNKGKKEKKKKREYFHTQQ